MRVLAATLISTFCLVSLFACSKPPQPPAGRWEGAYESNGTMVVARLEIMPNGSIYVSAPDAENVAAADGPALRRRLAQQLADRWGAVEPRKMDFDGHIFRKPGGIAPQMEWDSGSKRMTLVVYLGMRPGIRIPLRAVSDFDPDPWKS